MYIENEKIKVKSAKIVVNGCKDKPYYCIEYITIEGECHVGYGSYFLENVFNWLDEDFSIIGG